MMIALSPVASSYMLPIAGLPWYWRDLEHDRIDEVLPLVLAVDPDRTEAPHWRRDAQDRIGNASAGSVIVIAQCFAGLTLAYFFHVCSRAPDGRPRLVVDRLRWMELGRPHRSLDALLAIVLQTATRFACAEVLLEERACVERRARAALEQRASETGFTATAGAWRRVVPSSR